MNDDELEELLDDEEARWTDEQNYLSLGDLLFNQPSEVKQ